MKSTSIYLRIMVILILLLMFGGFAVRVTFGIFMIILFLLADIDEMRELERKKEEKNHEKENE